MKIQIVSAELIPDKYGKHIKITKIKVIDENGKYIKFAKLNGELLEVLKNAIIEIPNNIKSHEKNLLN